MANTYSYKFEYNGSDGSGAMVDSGQSENTKQDVINAMLDIIEHLRHDDEIVELCCDDSCDISDNV